MSYVNPANVYSPRRSIEPGSVKVLLDKGEGSFSIASLKWDGRPCIGIRWNGKNNNTGSPQSRGNPTWFILPQEIALSYADSIGNIEMKAIIERAK